MVHKMEVIQIDKIAESFALCTYCCWLLSQDVFLPP